MQSLRAQTHCGKWWDISNKKIVPFLQAICAVEPTTDLARARRRFRSSPTHRVRRVIRDFEFEGILNEEEAMFTGLALSDDPFILDILEFMGKEQMRLVFVLEPYYSGLSPSEITYWKECFELQHSSKWYTLLGGLLLDVRYIHGHFDLKLLVKIFRRYFSWR